MLACDAITPKKPIRSPTGRRKTLPPIHPNQGIEAAYRKKLDALITDMQRSIVWWIRAAYRDTPPIMAQDEPGAMHRLRREFETLGKRWTDRFEAAAPELARYFATAAKDRVDGALAAALRRAGISVRFQFTPAAREVFEATVAENVSLIRSIASQHLTQVEGAVFRSVTAGRDIGGLATELEQRFGVTKRRAAFIAQSQNAIATSTITAVRQRELGIVEAIWLHSFGGREPRKSHLAANGKTYKIAEGMELEEHGVMVRTWPGRLPRCRCTSKSIIPALQQ